MRSEKHAQIADEVAAYSTESLSLPEFLASLPDATRDDLYQKAAQFGVSPEEVLRAGVEYLLEQPDSILADLLKEPPVRILDLGEVSVSEEAERRQRMAAQLAMRGTPRPRPARDAWRRNLDQVRNNPILQEILEEAQRISESERPD